MLNEEGRKKLAFLAHLAKQGDPVAPDEVRWLIAQLQSTLSRPDEFEFPEYAAIYDPKRAQAFALLRVERPNWQTETAIEKDGLGARVEIFDRVAECDTHAAFLIVRPWIRIHSSVPESAVEVLRRSSITMTLDDVAVIRAAPIEDYLIAKDGGGLRYWMEFLRPVDKTIYSAYSLNMETCEADPHKPLGIFVANKTAVRIEIKGDEGSKHDEVRVIAGLTAMLYTTKAPGGGAALEFPRELKGADL